MVIKNNKEKETQERANIWEIFYTKGYDMQECTMTHVAMVVCSEM